MSEQVADGIEDDDVPGFWKKSRDDKKKVFDMKRQKENLGGGFKCSHCAVFVPINPEMGTAHRNHCNECLWSKHVDDKTSGDRKSACQAGMKPIGITLKHEGFNKYGKERLGDVMLIHECAGCGKCVINRIAADDPSETIMSIFDTSQSLPQETKDKLREDGINLLSINERSMVEERLYGR